MMAAVNPELMNWVVKTLILAVDFGLGKYKVYSFLCIWSEVFTS